MAPSAGSLDGRPGLAGMGSYPAEAAETGVEGEGEWDLQHLGQLHGRHRWYHD